MVARVTGPTPAGGVLSGLFPNPEFSPAGKTALSDTFVAKVPAATGVRATDEANILAAVASLPTPAGGKLVLGGGTYVAENLTVADLEYLELEGRGSAFELPTDDGLGGLGQILKLTDVIKFRFRDLTFDGNYANAKTGSVQNPLVHYVTTVATNGRKDFEVNGENITFNESAKGFGHFRASVYENATTTYSEFALVRFKNIRSLAAGARGETISIRGPFTLGDFDDIYLRNDGQYGIEAVGVPAYAMKQLGFSCEVSSGHHSQMLQTRNIYAYRTGMVLYTQMVQFHNSDGGTVIEQFTNPYWDQAATTFTADATTDVITAPIPALFGTSSLVKVTTTGTLPAPLVAGNIYTVRDPATDRLSFKLALYQGAAAINLTDAGTGTHSVQFLGYTYDTGMKGDDNKYSPEVPSRHSYKRWRWSRSSPHAGTRNFSWEESTADTSGVLNFEDCVFDRGNNFGAPRTGYNLRHSFERCSYLASAFTNVNVGTTSTTGGNLGLVDDCYFEENPTLAATRDLLVQSCRFNQGVILSAPGATVIRFLKNIWNLKNATNVNLEITPPATGSTMLVELEGNRIPPTATFETKLRVAAGGDLAGLTIFSQNDDFYTDASVGQANSTSLRFISRNNRNSRRARTDYPLLTLVNTTQPSVIGGDTWQTGGTSVITNFVNVVDYTTITVYILAGHTVGNSATIATKSGANIVGPAIREFTRLGGVWYER